MEIHLNEGQVEAGHYAYLIEKYGKIVFNLGYGLSLKVQQMLVDIWWVDHCKQFNHTTINNEITKCCKGMICLNRECPYAKIAISSKLGCLIREAFPQIDINDNDYFEYQEKQNYWFKDIIE